MLLGPWVHLHVDIASQSSILFFFGVVVLTYTGMGGKGGARLFGAHSW